LRAIITAISAAMDWPSEYAFVLVKRRVFNDSTDFRLRLTNLLLVICDETKHIYSSTLRFDIWHANTNVTVAILMHAQAMSPMAEPIMSNYVFKLIGNGRLFTNTNGGIRCTRSQGE